MAAPTFTLGSGLREEDEMMKEIVDAPSDMEIGSEDSTDDSGSSEWDQLSYQEEEEAESDQTSIEEEAETGGEAKTGWGAETGWNSSEITDWVQTGETGTGWDSSAATIPDFDRPDSGYSTLAGTPPRPSTPSPDEIKYNNLPFRTKHYFLTYIQRVLEQTCLRYARENLSEKLGDLGWKRRFMVSGSGDAYDLRDTIVDWLADDGAELERWMIMLARTAKYTGIPKDLDIMQAVIGLRNATVHRGDRQDFGFQELSLAMEFPSVIGESKGKSDISAAFRYIMDDPTLDEDTKASVESAMYTPPPCTTAHKLLGRIQTLLEESCFDNATRKIPERLEAQGWTMPEQVELQRWANFFQDANVQHDTTTNAFRLAPDTDTTNTPCPDLDTDTANTTTDPGFDSDFLVYLIHYARVNIRNVVAHRKPLTTDELIPTIHQAIALCIAQSDWDRAIEIEVLAEMYLTERTREQVRERLEGVYHNIGGLDSPYENQRRVAIAGFFNIDTTRHDQDGILSCPPFPCQESTSEEYQDPWTWSPSMHEILRVRKPVEDLEAGSSSWSDSDTPALEDEVEEEDEEEEEDEDEDEENEDEEGDEEIEDEEKDEENEDEEKEDEEDEDEEDEEDKEDQDEDVPA